MLCNQHNNLKIKLHYNFSPLRRSGGEVLECICSKLGGGLERAVVPVDSPVVAIEGPYATRAGELQDMVLRNVDCANLSAEYSLIDSHFSIIDDLKIANNQETDLYFYHSDHLGSSSFITDADGIVSQHLQYLPYGELFVEQRDNTARYYTPYKFSGKEKDEETGYSYFGARYYMPELSIWSAVDPMADERSWLSPYNYCQNNPIMLTDPDGMLDGDPDWVQNNKTGEYEWMDNVTSASNTPEGYKYIGKTENDILEDLNLPTQTSTIKFSTNGYAIDGDDGKKGAALGQAKIEAQGSLNIDANISYNKNNISENNSLGITFTGVSFNVCLSINSNSSNSDLSPSYSGYFSVSYGGKNYRDWLAPPTTPSIHQTGSTILKSSVNIPKSALSNSKSFGSAFISAGNLNSMFIKSPDPIKMFWNLQKRDVLRKK